MQNVFKISFLMLSVILISCSEDETVSDDDSNESSELIITLEKVKGTLETDTETIESNHETTLIANKRRASVSISDGLSVPSQYFNYNDDDLLTAKGFNGSEDNELFYNYNDNQIISDYQFNISAETTNYYQITAIDANKYYFERLTLPANDPATESFSRVILEFDANDNVIQAGRDNDNDGNYDTFKTFTYNSDNDLTAITNEEGEDFNFTYANIKNTQAYVSRTTYGKKNYNLHNAELFVISNIGQELATVVSVHYSNFEIEATGYSFELDDSGYFSKRTNVSLDGNFPETIVLSYTFQ